MEKSNNLVTLGRVYKWENNENGLKYNMVGAFIIDIDTMSVTKVGSTTFEALNEIDFNLKNEQNIIWETGNIQQLRDYGFTLTPVGIYFGDELDVRVENFDKTASSVLVGIVNDNCIIYEYGHENVNEGVHILDKALAFELVESGSVERHNGIYDSIIKLDSNARINSLVSHSYIDKYGYTHVVYDNSTDTLILSKADGKNIGEVRVKSLKKLKVPGSVDSIRVINVIDDNDTYNSNFYSEEDRSYPGKFSYTYKRLKQQTNIGTVEILEGVRIISNLCFYACNIESIVLPSTIKYIGSRAFENCKATRVELKEGIKYIGMSAFQMSHVAEIVVPDTVEYIDSWAFASKNISRVVLPKSLKYAGDYLFWPTLKELEIRSILCKSMLEKLLYSFYENREQKKVTITVPNGFDIKELKKICLRYNIMTNIIIKDK